MTAFPPIGGPTFNTRCTCRETGGQPCQAMFHSPSASRPVPELPLNRDERRKRTTMARRARNATEP